MKGMMASLMLGLLVAQAEAGTVTIATFADPAADATTPLFTYTSATGMLEGSWSNVGLTLETIDGNFVDATFTMSAPADIGTGDVGAGTVEFFDSAANSILLIEFDSGEINFDQVGATEFMSQNVVAFSGSILPDPPLFTDQESFAFSFANLVDQGGGDFTATAAFTSSATIIPEPATLALLALGAALGLRRRIA